MKVLLGCEESQIVCKAFRAKGHDAYSCDLKPCSGGHPEWHLIMDVFEAINLEKWDLLIAFPPCTYLTVSQNRWMNHPLHPDRKEKQDEAIEFFRRLLNCNVPRRALENPIGVTSSRVRPPDQIIHPYYFGDPLEKRTGLWLHGLPKLVYALEDTLFENKTAVAPEVYYYNSKRTKSGKSKYSKLGKLGSGKGEERSKFFPGVARAMADQWSLEEGIVNYE